MPAPLNLIHATVRTHDGTEHTGVSVSLPAARTTIIVRKGASVLLTQPGVVKVWALAPRKWEITFDDGTVWTAERTRAPCGCG